LKKAALKKMDMQASKEFLAELKVLTHVHHLNLVINIWSLYVCHA
jgi:chitin elicitor receptor kinase 1